MTKDFYELAFSQNLPAILAVSKTYYDAHLALEYKIIVYIGRELFVDYFRKWLLLLKVCGVKLSS